MDAAPSENAAPEPMSGTRGIIAGVLAWLFPGLGHAWLGDRVRAAVFAVVLIGMLAGGLALEGLIYRPGDGDPLTTLASLGAVGVGGPYVIAWAAGWGQGNFEAPYFEYGNTFTLVAGLLNFLVILDAYDRGRSRRT